MNMLVDWFKSWKLWSWRTAVVVAIVVYGLVGFFVVPMIAKKLIIDIARERMGREVSVGEVSCNPFALSLRVRKFSMPDRPGSVFLSFDEFYANAEVSSLFRWALTLKDLRVDNPYVGLRRFADGGINILELMDDIEQRTPADNELEDEKGLPRVLFGHILATGVAMDVEDRAREETLVWKFGPSRFEFRDISTIPDHEGESDFLIGMKHGGTIRVDGDVVVEPLGLDGLVVVEGVSLERTWEALQPFFDFAIIDGTAASRFVYSVTLADDGPHATIDSLHVRVEDLEVTAGSDDASVLKVLSFTMAEGSIAWPEAQVRVAEIVVEGAETLQWIRPDGTPSWDALVPKETQEQVVKTYREIEEKFPWDIAVDRFEIRDSIARVEDRTFDEPEQLVVEDANLALTDFRTGSGHQWGLTASAMLLGEAEATADGVVTTGPMGLELEVAMKDLDLGHFQRYIERVAPIELGAGRVEASGKARVGSGGEGSVASFAGDLTIHEIDLRETAVGSQVLKWGRVDARGIEAAAGPMSLSIESIDIHGAGIEVVVSEEGKVNLIELMAVMAERSSTRAGEEASGDETTTIPIKVAAINLHGCSAAYTDRTLTSPFTLAVDPVDGSLSGVSTTATAGAALDIDGPVRSGGDLHLEGEMDFLDPKRLTDLAIDVRQADMPPASPMAVRIIGHPMIEGKVDIDLDYEITNSELIGTNRFVTSGLMLGDRVEGDRVVDLPIKIGVSLLTDKNGQITLEFPVEGNLDDPNFGLGQAVSEAVKEITAELVKSPFRLLGKLGGGSDDEDFGFVEFKAGSAELGTNAADKLTTLAGGAEQRPELVLLIEGNWDPITDATGLKKVAFDAAVAEQSGAAGSSATLDVLESMYRVAVSRQALNELRAQHEGEETGLDETTYYRALRDAVIEAQPVDQAEVVALAGARAEAIRVFLVEGQSVDAARVRVIDPVVAEEQSEDGWVRCRLDVDAGA